MCSENKELTIEEKRHFLYKKTEELQKVSWDIKRVSDQDVKAYNAASNIEGICNYHKFHSPIETFKLIALGLLREKEIEIQKQVDQYIK